MMKVLAEHKRAEVAWSKKLSACESLESFTRALYEDEPPGPDGEGENQECPFCVKGCAHFQARVCPAGFWLAVNLERWLPVHLQLHLAEARPTQAELKDPWEMMIAEMGGFADFEWRMLWLLRDAFPDLMQHLMQHRDPDALSPDEENDPVRWFMVGVGMGMFSRKAALRHWGLLPLRQGRRRR
jgi:hypothetical protein